MTGQKKRLPVWMWIALVVLGLAIVLVAGTEVVRKLRPKADRPLRQLIDEVDCDRLDLGEGSARFFCNDGTMWIGTPFELGERAQ